MTTTRRAPASATHKWEGHEKIETTQEYMHLARGEISRAISLLNNRKVWVNELLASRGRRGPLVSRADEELEK